MSTLESAKYNSSMSVFACLRELRTELWEVTAEAGGPETGKVPSVLKSLGIQRCIVITSNYKYKK